MVNYLSVTLAGLGLGSAYALVALGFSFLIKTTDSINFAQGTVMSIGGLVTYTVYVTLGWPWALALLAVVIVAAIVGGITERAAVFPLVRRGDPPLHWLMSTLGVSVLLAGVAVRIWGAAPLPVPVYFGGRVIKLGNSTVPTPYLWAFVVAMVITALFYVFERYTPWGRTMRAIANNRSAVRLAGVNVLVYSLAAYMVAAAVAGIGGFIVVPVTFASVDGAFLFTIYGFAAMAIGGFGSHIGAMIGGWLVGLVVSVGGAIFGLEYSTVMVFVFLLVILMIRPSGLFVSRNVRTI